MAIQGFAVPSTMEGLALLGITLLVLWAAVSVPVYISGKLITHGKASLGSAMGATLGGATAYVIVLYGGAFLLTPVLGALSVVASFLLAMVAWLAVYRSSFNTSWAGAVGIVVVGWIVLLVIETLLVSLLGVALPRLNPLPQGAQL